MAESTNIAWCDSTANCWMGCTKVSPACDSCYADELCGRRFKQPWGPHADRRYVKAGWQLLRQMQARAEKNGGVDPALGRRRRIFINSLSDTFDNHRSIVWRDDAFALMAQCTHLDLILVTKRPQNVSKMVPARWMEPGGWPSHVWLLTTAEDEKQYHLRGAVLSSAALSHVAVRGMSIEPMLERWDIGVAWFDWYIFGGESGTKARTFDEDGAAVMIAQIRHQGRKVFVKQLGQANHRKTYGDFYTFPAALQIREFPNG